MTPLSCFPGIFKLNILAAASLVLLVLLFKIQLVSSTTRVGSDSGFSSSSTGAIYANLLRHCRHHHHLRHHHHRSRSSIALSVKNTNCLTALHQRRNQHRYPLPLQSDDDGGFAGFEVEKRVVPTGPNPLHN